MNKIRNLKFFGLVCILAFALVIIGFHFLQAQVKATGKPAPPPPPALPLLFSGDIITTESDALSVWRYPSDVPIWTKKTESYYYNLVAVGDVDSDTRPEIVVPVVKPIGRKGTGFKIFIDVYNEGSGIPISSENYSPGYFTDPSRVICNITIANVIPEDGAQIQINEIVLQHWYNLVIFKWDGTNFGIVKRIQARKTELPLLCLNGTTTKNFDTDQEEEVFVSGQMEYSGPGYIFEIDMKEDASYTLTPIDSTEDLAIDGNEMGIGHSLRVADLDGDGDLEICLPGLLEIRPADVSYWKAYLLVLDQGQWNSTIIPGYEKEKNVNPHIDLDVGELDSTRDGEEITLYVNQQKDSDYYLYIFYYPSNLFLIEYQLLYADSINDIKIGNISGNKIAVCGTAPPLKGTILRKYFEVFEVAISSPSSLQSCWKVLGESGSITDLAIVN